MRARIALGAIFFRLGQDDRRSWETLAGVRSAMVALPYPQATSGCSWVKRFSSSSIRTKPADFGMVNTNPLSIEPSSTPPNAATSRVKSSFQGPIKFRQRICTATLPAGRVTSKGFNYTPEVKVLSLEWDAPPPMCRDNDSAVSPNLCESVKSGGCVLSSGLFFSVVVERWCRRENERTDHFDTD